MGHSRAHKTKTHKRIVSIASKRFREKGLTGFGIAELMKEAGLTVAGSTSTSIRVTIWLRKRLARPTGAGNVEWTLPKLAGCR